MSGPIISFTTDFATADGYVGAVRGVILSICPHARILDITHDIPPQDVYHASFVLRTAVNYYPKGAVHLAVVDPAVGTERRAICVKTENYLFIGPDNGLFTPFLNDAQVIYSLENENFWRKHVSQTFHGRDIFGPVAAHLALGVSPATLGPMISDPARLDFWDNEQKEDKLEGAIVHIDHFGNCITSFSPEDIAKYPNFRIYLAGQPQTPEAMELFRTYAESALGEGCWLTGSTGLVELAVNGGNAAEKYHIERGDRVFVESRD